MPKNRLWVSICAVFRADVSQRALLLGTLSKLQGTHTPRFGSDMSDIVHLGHSLLDEELRQANDLQHTHLVMTSWTIMPIHST